MGGSSVSAAKYLGVHKGFCLLKCSTWLSGRGLKSELKSLPLVLALIGNHMEP